MGKPKNPLPYRKKLSKGSFRYEEKRVKEKNSKKYC